MAMKTASPWWFSALFAVGLLALFIGERPFDHITAVRLLCSGSGAVLILGITALRAWTFSATRGDRRAVERMLLMCHAGVLLALLGYLLTTDWGRGLVGAGGLEDKALERYTVSMTVLWTIALLVSLVPLLLIEQSLGIARRTAFRPGRLGESDIDQEAVESFRVREMANSGLTIGLATALLLTTCNVAQQRNIRRDVSYFKTSSPGASTQNIVKSVSEPVTVYLFFPEVNQVKNELLGYFTALREATGSLEIEEHDHLLANSLAKKLGVKANGTVVVAYNDKYENLTFTYDPDEVNKRKARNELRELDRKVNSALLKVIKARRTAYLTIGHGELNDRTSEWTISDKHLEVTLLRRRLKAFNYDVKDLSMANGLGTEIPDDATFVMILGPSTTFMDEELASIERYLNRGGRLLIALDPRREAGLGSLEGRLGVTFDRASVIDDGANYLPGRQPSLANRRFIKTNRFSSHAAITSLSQASAQQGTAFLATGSFQNVEPREEYKGKLRRMPVISSMPSSFADRDDDLQFDEGTEKRDQYSLVLAVEDPDAIPESADGSHEGMRALLFGDVESFSDPFQGELPSASAMLDDAILWLGGQEALAGEIVSEADVRIQHTRNEDEVWFYSTILGAPLLVLAFGLWFGWWRRQRLTRRTA